MHRISNIRYAPGFDISDARLIAARALKCDKSRVRTARISKKSIDARDKRDVKIMLSVDFEAPGVELPPSAVLIEPFAYNIPRRFSKERPVIVGFGPAGLFAGYVLAKAGLKPLIIERGRRVDQRRADVDAFWAGGELNEDSNVQFGEGGAGAFSDGKLNTGITDERCQFVLRTFVRHGAPEEILYESHPHVGTDKLPLVVKSMRAEILKLGGEILFQTKLNDLLIEDGAVRGITANDRQIDAKSVILAIGHSARDTFEKLLSLGVPMQAKPFSIGARIEHSQKMINFSQYGPASRLLGAADYKLAARSASGRGVYTFCMCPGGYVVAAASEKGALVTNGMSEFKRDGQNANSALLASIDPSDYGPGVLAGVEFQRKWERAAYNLTGGYKAPAQLVGDFLKGQPSTGAGDVEPSYKPGVCFSTIEECLPDFVTQTMREGILMMDRRLKGFASPGAVLTGVETRSSSPVRILRGDDFQSPIAGLYPCGEGAGYAGGIMSSAADGVRVAEEVMKRG